MLNTFTTILYYIFTYMLNIYKCIDFYVFMRLMMCCTKFPTWINKVLLLLLLYYHPTTHTFCPHYQNEGNSEGLMIDRWLMSSQRLIGRGKKEEGLDLWPPPTLAWKDEHDDGSAMVKLVSWIDSAPLPVVLNFAIQKLCVP